MTETDRGLEKLSAWLGFWKTLIVSGGVVILGAALNHQITALQLNLEDRRAGQALSIEAERTKRDLDLRRLEIENEYLAQFVQEALGENLERRRRFAQYFALLTREDASRERWEEYLAQVESEFGRTTVELNDRIAEFFQRL